MASKIKIYFLIFFLFWIHSSKANNNIDSILTLLDLSISKSDNSNILKYYNELGLAYFESDQYQLSIDCHQKAIDLAKQLNDYDALSTNLLGQGNSFKRVNKNTTALENYFAILEIDSNLISISSKTKAFTYIGSIYQKLGDYDNAFDYQIKALNIFEAEKDSSEISHICYNIGTLFYYQNQLEQSLEYYSRCNEIAGKLGFKRGIYASLEALGSLHHKMGNIEESRAYTKKSLDLAYEMNYKTGIAYGLGNMATDEKSKGNYAKAEQLFLESIKIKTELDDAWGQSGSYLELSKLYMKWEQPKKAIRALQKAEELSLQINSKPRLMATYKVFHDAYSINNKAKALDYLEQYVALKDSVFHEKMAEEMGQTKNRYELEKKENEIALLKKENELTQANKEVHKLQKYVFLFITIFFMGFCYVIFSRLKLQKTTNILLEEKNKEIKIQNLELQHTQDQLLHSNILLEEKNLLLADKNDEIFSKNKLLESSNEDLAQFAYVASHDLKEPLRMIGSYTTLLKRRYNDLYDDAGKEFMHYIVDAVGRMETMLTDLLSYSRVGTQTDTRTWVDMEDMMVIVEANLRGRLQDENAKLVYKPENFHAVKANRTHMMQLLQNLVSNAIKFRGERDPVVTVDSTYEKGIYTFSVKDNGIGISEENLKKVFEMFRRLHTRDEYEGTGIGLATCKKIVSKHGGDIWVESVEGEGSTFFFTIPCPVQAPTKVQV